MLTRLPSLEEVRRERAERSLRYFIEWGWRWIEPGAPFVPGWHIDAICEYLQAISEGQIRRLIINIPPRHSKSTLVSVAWPAWDWIKNPDRKYLTSSYAMSLAIRDALKSRRLIASPWYQERWADRFRLQGDQNTKSRYENNKGGHRIAVSVGSAVTGEGGDILSMDDPHNAMAAQSDVARQATIDWFREAWSTRQNDPKTAAMLVIMQRLHEKDLSGVLLEQGGWEHLCLPAEADRPVVIHMPISGCEIARKPGDLLWPERFGRQEINELRRTLGAYGASGQLDQRPSPAEGGLLKRTYWRYWTSATLPPKFSLILTSWDLTFKSAENTDYVVGQVWGAAGADRYLLDQVRGRWDFPETLERFQTLVARWPTAAGHLVEDKANGPALISSLRRAIPGIVPVTPGGSKVERVHAVLPTIEAGNVYLPDPSMPGFEWVSDMIEEAAQFPAGAHDDQVDAMTQALIRLARGLGATVTAKPKGW